MEKKLRKYFPDIADIDIKILLDVLLKSRKKEKSSS